MGRVAVVSYCQECLSAVPVPRQDSVDWNQIRLLLPQELMERLEAYSFDIRCEVFRLRKQLRSANKSVERTAVENRRLQEWIMHIRSECTGINQNEDVIAMCQRALGGELS